VIYLWARPVLIDSEAETYNMDPALLEEAIRRVGGQVRDPALCWRVAYLSPDPHPSVASEGGQPNDNIEHLRVYLERNGIESRALWKPLHCMPAYREYPHYLNGVSESLFKRGLCLPSGPCVTVEDVKMIVGLIKGVIE